ncbi:hypothetical protein [Deinococcus yavapaiensis]|uniref:Lipoprotein n=1 Tax=Deinococcus yavapaiensis KR-236 TaxID=694435 RepID=A0A318SHH9_9DEIO|nr:hypothetical protein [Deinococcus yavapaiensis]PYE50472.1 hypothetical protein DES52_11889 [Deinococcus yavapaiensis KR-236]
MQTRPRFLPALGLAALLTLLGACGSSSTPNAQGSGSPPPSSGPSEVQGLVERLHMASTSDGRTQALKAAMNALRIGVYTPEGKAVVVGAERDAKDFYLYDLELNLLAESYARGDTYTLGQVATSVNQLGLFEGDREVTPQELQTALRAATRSAVEHPDDPASLGPLMVRGLGLEHKEPFDTLEDVPLEKIRLDALQRFLVMAEVTLPAFAQAGPLQGVTHLSALSSNVFRSAATSSSPCEDLGTVTSKGGPWTMGKWFLGNLPALKNVNLLSKALLVTIDMWHGMIMAATISVDKISGDGQATRYGGPPIDFKIRVFNHFQHPETMVKCGWLLGVEFPAYGGLKGVTVAWLNLIGNLRDHGTLNCGNTICTSETDANGYASVVFTPKPELNAVGEMVTERGTLGADAFVQLKLKNTLGAISNLIFPAGALMDWFVLHRQAPGWSGTVTVKQVLKDSYSQTNNGLEGSGSRQWQTITTYHLFTDPATGDIKATAETSLSRLTEDRQHSRPTDRCFKGANGGSGYNVTTDYTRTSITHEDGEAGVTALAGLSISNKGDYRINVGAGDLMTSGTTTTKVVWTGHCKASDDVNTTTTEPVPGGLPSGGGGITGTAPADAKHLSGSKTETSPDGKTTTTYTWNLNRAN